jgi:transcriptional regulator with XRE-family HTH domain
MHDSSPRLLDLAQCLHQARLEQQYSFRVLSRITGIPRSTILRLEKAEVERPPADNLVRLARALELNEVDVLGLAGIAVPRLSASLDVMLRTEYDLPPESVLEVKQRIQDIIDEYDRQ